MYRELDLKSTIATIIKLKLRISDRFPNSSLANISNELLTIAKESSSKIAFISKPITWLRVSLISIILLTLAMVIYSISVLNLKTEEISLVDLISLAEASINDLLLIGAALYFLFKIETKIKRNRALDALHELRSIAHVIDMHQLTKDPKNIAQNNTKNSPKRTMSLYELSRYLDYCSEMLALSSKVAALYANGFKDEVVLQTINEIETLTASLSSKIWQKIMILDRVEE